MRQFKPSAVFPLAMIMLAVSGCWTSNSSIAQVGAQGLDFPYQAIVLRDEAPIHSGPGDVHYATQRLKQGDVVEVYRHDPGGWCAIRPVAGSFSLVPESTLKVVGNGVGKITEDGTQAWVGTELGAVGKPLWQVKLRKDEMVEVLGQASWPSPEGHSIIWYQIASPAGEFRWIRMSDIQLPVASSMSNLDQSESRTETVQANHDVASRSPALDRKPPIATYTSALSGVAESNGYEGRQAAFEFQNNTSDTSSDASTNSINGGWRQATRPINRRHLDAADPSASVFSQDDFSNPNSHVPGFDAEAFRKREYESHFQDNQSRPMRMASNDAAARQLADELSLARGAGYQEYSTGNVSDLDLKLTEEMLKSDPLQWRLDVLESSAQTLLSQSGDPEEQIQARKFLAKIVKCRNIQDGYRGNLTPNANQMTPSTQPIGAGFSQNNELDNTYDAHGWLNKMVRNGGSSESTFVLQDARGKVTHHISPTPGLNLQPYLKSRIGIIGQRGYHSQLKLNHVTAHRIIQLETQR